MTRAFGQLIHCPHCGAVITQESAFSRWVREQPELDSSLGYVTTDQDLEWQLYCTGRGRDFQLMMHIEIKTNGAELSPSQRDSLHMKNQIIRNRRQTPTKPCQWQSGTAPLRVYSEIARRKVWLRHYGVHVLQFSGLGPEDSEWIRWDRRLIDVEMLLKILKFEVDPDTLRPMDFRSHHKQKVLPFVAGLFATDKSK